MSDLRNRFEYHPPKDQITVDLHQEVRDSCYELARKFGDLLPVGREAALAMTKLEEAMFWANAAIARVYSKYAD